MLNADWYYEEKDPVLVQGELIRDCPKIVFPSSIQSLDDFENEENKFDVECNNSVIVSQSCDLAQKKIPSVLLCPYYTLAEIIEENPVFKSSNYKEALRRGYLPGYHLLNKIDSDENDDSLIVVVLHSVFSIPIEYLSSHAMNSGQRICLNSPYKEHLSQAFARFFMRVGLPIDLPPFKKSMPDILNIQENYL